MKSAEQWIEEMWNETHYGEPSLPMKDRIKMIQSDATADLQSQVEQLRGGIEKKSETIQKDCSEIDELKSECRDLGEQRDMAIRETSSVRKRALRLRTALEKCVVALESIRDFDDDSPFDDPGCIAVEALADLKPLLNKP